MNPMMLMKLKGLFERFKNNHPKVPMFCNAAAQAIGEDSVIEISVTTAEGKNLCTNMKVCADDMELVRQLTELLKN